MIAPASSEKASLGLDGTLVINVRSFVERRESIERQLRSCGLTYEFIHMYDACDLDGVIRGKYFKDSSLTLGQQSCAMKHLQALRIVVERNWQRALILEDDIILSDDFMDGLYAAVQESSCLSIPHVLFIGSGGNLYTPRSMRVPGQRLYRAAKGRLGEAYILDSRTASMRIAWIERHGITLPIDNLFDRMDREMEIVPYWLEEPIVEQGSKNGTFVSTLEPSPAGFIQRVKFGWQKLRRKYVYQMWR